MAGFKISSVTRQNRSLCLKFAGPQCIRSWLLDQWRSDALQICLTIDPDHGWPMMMNLFFKHRVNLVTLELRQEQIMNKLWKAASIIAAVSVITGAAIQLNATSAFSQATGGRVGLQPVPPNCYDSKIQVPTRGGPEWKQLIMCPSE